jgi:hypothetical protein
MSSDNPKHALQVRPTLRALKLLPADEPTVAAALSMLDRARQAPDSATQRAILAELQLGQLQHPILDDVRTTLKQGGMPDVHKSTKADGRTVYEARSRTGAAWRGAFVLEGGTWWLVYASPHDRFHSTAADYMKKGSWPPSPLDKQLAAQDAEYILRSQWRVTALTTILDALSRAVAEARRVEFELADATGTAACTLRLEIEHDEPAPTADLAHTTSGMLQISLLIRGAGRELVNAILALLAFVRDGEQEQSYLPGGDLHLMSTMSHARLVQLTADVNETTDVATQASTLPTPTALHYVSKEQLAAGAVIGTAVMSLCGQWFVPRVDGSADLPVCATCEDRKPLAQAMLDGLRS